jgi:hypothetical protein
MNPGLMLKAQKCTSTGGILPKKFIVKINILSGKFVN